MKHPRILVTGATGKIGRHVVHLLLQAGWPVRALVRQNDVRSLALQRQGAEIAVADLTDPEPLALAMQGVQRAFFLPGYSPYLANMAAAFACAARSAGLESVVVLSQWLAAPSHPASTTRQHWLADRLLGALPGMAHTRVAPGFFADNYLRTLPVAAQLGVLPWPYGDGRNAPPSNEDIARVAAHALMQPQRHAGRSYRPTGPQLLTGGDMARIVGKVLGRSVKTMPTPFWLFAKAARHDGAGIDELLNLRHYIRDHSSGAFEVGALNQDVLEVTGRPAEDFETIARRYAAAPQCQPTLGNRLRQVKDFLLLPLRPGYDLNGYARSLNLPQPQRPLYAMQSGTWLREHGLPAEGGQA